MSLIVHFDGGARGNPGPAGAGVVICGDDEKPLFEGGFYLGPLTNNAAEYNALLRSLERVALAPPQPVQLHSDSELLVRQITGEYQVKSPALEQLYVQAQRLLLRISHWSIRHVRRDANKRADQLANLAMDERRDVIVLDRLSAAPGSDAPEPARGGEAAGKGARDAAPRARRKRQDASDSHGGAANAASPAERRVRVVCGRAPAEDACPDPPAAHGTWDIASTVPTGMCLSAAQAILPTVLAIQNAGAEDFPNVPALTVRCARPGCGATFVVSPLAGSNGSHSS